MRANAVNLATFTNALCHRNATPLNKVKMGQCLGGGLLSLSLSLVARTFWHINFFKHFIFGLFALVIASRFCENGVAIHKFSVIFAFWIATLALLARNDGKAQIQIFYSKFKAFCKFNSFYKFNSNFKPYTRLFHIFTPSFRSVQTDKKFFTRRTLCLNRIF